MRMPHRRNEIEGLDLRGSMSSLILRLLKITHQHQFPNERFARALPLIVIYLSVLKAYASGKAPRAAEIERELGFSHETCRRHLISLVDRKLLTCQGGQFRPCPERVGRIEGLSATAVAVRRAVAALERLS